MTTATKKAIDLVHLDGGYAANMDALCLIVSDGDGFAASHIGRAVRVKLTIGDMLNFTEGVTMNGERDFHL